MYSNKALTSMLFIYTNTTKSIMRAIDCKPDDQAEWQNILQKMCNLRQALACSICGKFVSNPFTPVKEACHCVCADCHNSIVGNTQQQLLIHNNCLNCRNAFLMKNDKGIGNGFEANRDVNHIATGFIYLCKILMTKDIVNKFSTLQVSTQNGPITFGQLIQEGSSSEDLENEQNLGIKFRKRIKEKEHHCRCGSGSKKFNGKVPGNLTCIGQRCACYKDGKGCVNCKCLGCKNPNGTPSKYLNNK